MTIGSLFSGIGGLELGLEWAGLGPTLWQVETDPFCRSVLAKHWPKVDRSVRDVADAGKANLAPVDLVCGGFPCQDVADSEGLGLGGARSGLWFAMLDAVRVLRPRFVVVENVADLAVRGLDRVLAGFAALGFDAEWITFRSADVGHAHGRARLFIVAYADGNRRESESSPRLHVRGKHGKHADRCDSFVPGPDDGANAWDTFRGAGGPEPGIRRGVDGFPTRLDRRRLAALGNAVDPLCAYVVGLRVRELAS